jgi:hypothetical protein
MAAGDVMKGKALLVDALMAAERTQMFVSCTSPAAHP